eukprot:g27989.t1
MRHAKLGIFAVAACATCFISPVRSPLVTQTITESRQSKFEFPSFGCSPQHCALAASAVLGLAVWRGMRARTQLGANRREAILACTLTGAIYKPKAAVAQAQYQLDNREAYLREKARILNFAADWYLFDVKPLVHPMEELEMGQTCPDVKSLAALREMYKANNATNAGAGAVVSTFERNVLNAVDPDTSEELQEIFQKFELNQFQLGKAAREEKLDVARQKFDEGRLLMNNFFSKIDKSVGLKPSDEIYFAPMPVDNKASQKSPQIWQADIDFPRPLKAINIGYVEDSGGM